MVDRKEEVENIGRRRGPRSYRLRVRVLLFGCATPRRDDGVKRARYSRRRRGNETRERAAGRGNSGRFLARTERRVLSRRGSRSSRARDPPEYRALLPLLLLLLRDYVRVDERRSPLLLVIVVEHFPLRKRFALVNRAGP